MNRADYRHLTQSQQDARAMAWQWIFQNWGCKDWQVIKQDVRLLLALPSTLGICHGQLVTRAGASGINEFINRMNRSR